MRDDTKITHIGRDPHANHGIVNPPVYRASTILFPTLEAMRASHPDKNVHYGRYGTPTTAALTEAIAALDGAAGAVAVGSGKSAIVGTLLSLTKAGNRLLVVDSAYAPTRAFASGMLKRFGVETTYYDPRLGEGIADLIDAKTRVLFLESPGSLTFEVQDVPALVQAAKAKNPDIAVVIDNTWATPLFFKPLKHGVDVSIQAGTKYVGGHSDLMLGLVGVNEQFLKPVRAGLMDVVGAAAPDDCWLALRGLRTMAVRLARHCASGIEVAKWLQEQDVVEEVLHPALETHPDHALFRRDFKGASGLFGFRLKPGPKGGLAAMLDRMKLFGMGYSWGGFESLLIPCDPTPIRTATPWSCDGCLLRIHVGLEDPADLIEDLKAGLERYASG